ncbi:MAG: ISKra4 family transposase [Bryobacteraceae bacterium]
MLAGQLASDVAAEIDSLLGRGSSDGLDLEAIETAARRQALGLAARAIEQRFNADSSDYAGAHLPCPCGDLARYAGRRVKSLQSVLGELKLERAYYHCQACCSGFYPRDRQLGIEKTSLSPAVVRMIGKVGAMVSFQEGSALLEELAGLDVDASQVERGAEALGDEIATDERRYTEPLDESALPHTLYMGLDGTGIPMRTAELAGRAGKQPDGSAKTREVKLCVFWSAEARDPDGLPMRDPGSVTYSAAIESAAMPDSADQSSAFAERVSREASRRRFSEASRRAILGDGAPWIWNIAQELFPGAIQIVDRFHVKETLHRTAQSIFGASNEQSKLWATARCTELDEGKLRAIVHALRPHAESSTAAAKCRLYIYRNRHRMRYPKFREQGLCTSSGVVEAGCKVSIGTRLKRAGMHWTLKGANAIIALRCCHLGGRFQDFWERRNDPIAA